MKIHLLAVFILAGFTALSQNMRYDRLIAVSRNSHPESSLTLEAKFTASITEGLVPLKVQFTDQSTGSPVSWKWQFGDGDSSLLQNPSHTYNTIGAYTVRLTVSDGKNNYTLEKNDYIRVNLSLNACDTMHFPLPKPYTYNTIPNGGGYVSGNNLYRDKAICDYFDNMQSIAVTGVFFDFCKVKMVSGTDQKIPVCVWKHESTTGTPGSLLFSDTLLLSKIMSNFNQSRFTSLQFRNPVQIDGSFFMGIVLPDNPGDTLAFWSTPVGKIPVNTAWIMTSDGRWTSAQDLWPPVEEQKFMVSNAIFPTICRVDGIYNRKPGELSIHPNPVLNQLRIIGKLENHIKLQYRIVDITGITILSGSIEDRDGNIDVQLLKPGIYLLQLTGEEIFTVQKFLKL